PDRGNSRDPRVGGRLPSPAGGPVPAPPGLPGGLLSRLVRLPRLAAVPARSAEPGRQPALSYGRVRPSIGPARGGPRGAGSGRLGPDRRRHLPAPAGAAGLLGSLGLPRRAVRGVDPAWGAARRGIARSARSGNPSPHRGAAAISARMRPELPRHAGHRLRRPGRARHPGGEDMMPRVRPRAHITTLGVLLIASVVAIAWAQVPPSAAEQSRYVGLLAAAARGDAAEIRTLTGSGASPEVLDGYQRTPLHVGGYNGA